MKRKVNIASIKPNPDNPRFVKDSKFKKLVKSIKEFPEMLEKRPIIVDENMVVLGGNMRLKACKSAGLFEVWIDEATGWSDEKKKEFIIKDNVGFGEWDWDILANEWDANDLDDWGLDLPDIFEADPEAQEDDYEEPDDLKVDVVLGDLIEIGNHRLLCGDSTDSDQVAKLMDGKKADISFTSPPYNAGKSEKLSGNTYTDDNKYNLYNDNQSKDDYLKLLIDFTNNSLMFSNYLVCNIQSLAGNKIAIIEYLYNFKDNFIDVAIWDKEHAAPAMAENVFNSVWEYMFFLSPKTNPTRAIPNANFRGDTPNIYRGKPNRNNKFSNYHAATFPIDLPEWVLKFTNKNDIVLDLFLGSGTTMVAAHQLDRVCYGMELDPKYCQVIIDRMLNLDENLKIRINGKKYDRVL
jgi:DNA modification methylase